MKKKYTFLVLFLAVLLCHAQQGINYKALIKDSSGNVVANQSITIEFDILRGAGFNLIYTESHNPTTNTNGIVIVNIGEGTVLNGDFSTIDWSLDTHFLNVEIDIGNGLEDFGRTEFKTVPYAIQAETALNVSGLEAIDEGNGTGWRLIGKNPNNYGDIGEGAVDLSFNAPPSSNGATGLISFASGLQTIAIGDFSTAMGINTEASGSSSSAFGSSTVASGNVSTAFGSSTTASGDASMAIGWNTEATGLYALAGGIGSDATGESALAFGLNAQATNNYTIAIGDNAQANSINAIAMGDNAQATNTNAIAIGINTEASGVSSFAMGNGTVASGNASTAMGVSTEASGVSSSAIGFDTLASGNTSTAMGGTTQALGEYATSMGLLTTARAYSSTAIGRYNWAFGNLNTWVGTDPVFEIGIGTSNSARNNAMTVLKNGNVGIGTVIPNNKLQIINGTDVSASNGLGFLVLGNAGGRNIAIDNNEIMARNNNIAAPLYLQNEGGPEASLSDNTGYLVLGNENFSNLVLDGNEIQARVNGSASTLFLQHAGGNVAVNGLIVHTSDRRLKKNIQSLNYGLTEIMKLNPVTYNWKNRPNQKQRSLGLIAQELKEVISELVSIEKNKEETLHVNYTELIPVLIKAIQEQQEIIQKQQEIIQEEKAENKIQKITLENVVSRLEALEAQNN